MPNPRELEAVIECEQCGTKLGIVYRDDTGAHGVGIHVSDPPVVPHVCTKCGGSSRRRSV